MRGCGHTKTGHGSQRQAQNSFKPPPYLITDDSAMGTDSGTNGHVWHRKLNFKWLQLPRSLSLSRPFLFVSFFLQTCLCFCSLMDVFSPEFQDRMDRDACFIFSYSSCCYLFHFLTCLSLVDKLSCQMTAHPSLCWLENLKRNLNNRERGRVMKLSFWKRQLYTKRKRINQN